MDMILHMFHQGITAVLPVVVLLSLLIFVHEMGHFLVAKFFKVRVEVFSIGFGKKILQMKRGDTTYCISVIPIGGYVKMFGDEPGAQVAEDQKRFSFSHKPVYQRFLVVLAGPMINFLFAIVLFAAMAFIGEQMLTPVVGDVPATSEAYHAGFHPGDTIKSINGRTVTSWDDIQDMVETNANHPLVFTLVRDGQNFTLRDTPKLVKNKVILSTRRYVGEIEGLSPNSRATSVGVSDPKSLAAQAGLKTGDVITFINGKEISAWRELEAQVLANAGQQVEIKFERQADEKKSDSFTAKLAIPATMQDPKQALAQMGIEPSDLFLSQIFDKSPAAEAGLSQGDKIITVGGVAISQWDQVVETVKSYRKDSGPLTVVVMRNGEQKRFDIVPQMTKHMSPQGKEEERFTLGILPLVTVVNPPPFIQRTTNPIAALARGWQWSIKWTELTLIGFERMLKNEVSPKNLGGIISIGQVASRSFEIGVSAFLSIMAIISINLFIVNLLPVPVLDGGHLLFYSLEFLRGKPLSLKKLEIAQQVGLILLVSLMAFALFNDVSRFFSW